MMVADIIKFTRTICSDYMWLITSSNLVLQDYKKLEKIYNDYEVSRNRNNNIHCGMIQLCKTLCLFSCYKTNFYDNFGRPIYSMDALCFVNDLSHMVKKIYPIFLSSPEEYIHKFAYRDLNIDYIMKENDIQEDMSNYYENYDFLIHVAIKKMNSNYNLYNQLIDPNNKFDEPVFIGFDVNTVKDLNKKNEEYKNEICHFYMEYSKIRLFMIFKEYIVTTKAVMELSRQEFYFNQSTVRKKNKILKKYEESLNYFLKQGWKIKQEVSKKEKILIRTINRGI